MKTPAISVVALAAAALLNAAPAVAQLYKWTDANGRVQYSDKPPPTGQKASQISRATGGATVAAAPAGSAETARASGTKSAAELEQDFRKRKAEQDEAQKKSEKLAEDARVKQENCARSKAQLSGLEAGGRMVRYEPNGERRFLEDSDIQQETAKARQDIAKWCNG